MTRKSYAGWRAEIGLRMLAIILLILVRLAWLRLFGIAQAEPHALNQTGELLLAMLAYVGTSLGGAFFVLGPHLFDRIAVAARWERRS